MCWPGARAHRQAQASIWRLGRTSYGLGWAAHVHGDATLAASPAIPCILRGAMSFDRRGGHTSHHGMSVRATRKGDSGDEHSMLCVIRPPKTGEALQGEIGHDFSGGGGGLRVKEETPANPVANGLKNKNGIVQ